jgi:hypothetical protein
MIIDASTYVKRKDLGSDHTELMTAVLLESAGAIDDASDVNVHAVPEAMRSSTMSTVADAFVRGLIAVRVINMRKGVKDGAVQSFLDDVKSVCPDNVNIHVVRCCRFDERRRSTRMYPMERIEDIKARNATKRLRKFLHTINLGRWLCRDQGRVACGSFTSRD